VGVKITRELIAQGDKALKRKIETETCETTTYNFMQREAYLK